MLISCYRSISQLMENGKWNQDTTEKTVFGRIEREEAGRGRQGKEKEKRGEERKGEEEEIEKGKKS